MSCLAFIPADLLCTTILAIRSMPLPQRCASCRSKSKEASTSSNVASSPRACPASPSSAPPPSSCTHARSEQQQQARRVWEESDAGVAATTVGEPGAGPVRCGSCVSCGRSPPCGCAWQGQRQPWSAAAGEPRREANIRVAERMPAEHMPPEGFPPRHQGLSREREKEIERAGRGEGGEERNPVWDEKRGPRDRGRQGAHEMLDQTTRGSPSWFSCRPQQARPQGAPYPPLAPRWQPEGAWRSGGCNRGWASDRR